VYPSLFDCTIAIAKDEIAEIDWAQMSSSSVAGYAMARTRAMPMPPVELAAPSGVAYSYYGNA
jgi:hypothetical protein